LKDGQKYSFFFFFTQTKVWLPSTIVGQLRQVLLRHPFHDRLTWALHFVGRQTVSGWWLSFGWSDGSMACMAPKKTCGKNEIPSWDWFRAFFFFLVSGQCLFFVGGRQYPHVVSRQRSCETRMDQLAMRGLPRIHFSQPKNRPHQFTGFLPILREKNGWLEEI